MTARTMDILALDHALTSAVDRVRSALRAAEFAVAARESLDILRAQPSHLPALVTLALAVQLANDRATLDDFSLDDARAALAKASRLQSTAGDAEHELVRFLFAVDNNSEAALEVVERAASARAAQLRDLLAVKVEILQDLGRRPEAKSVAQTALKIFPNDADFRAALR